MASYQVEVTEQARKEIRLLPGNMRQRVLRTLQSLQHEPRPSSSRALDMTDLEFEVAHDVTLQRIRLDAWRIVYLIEEEAKFISILAIRKRPPYQYDDLIELLTN